MPIGTHFSITPSGDIRHATGSSTWTVLEFHRWLQNLADDAAASGDDLLDITNTTPSQRATDNIITLNAPYNIDDTTAEYLYDGSIEQASGGTLYSGLVVVGSLAGTTTLQVVQNNALYDGDSPFWDEAPSGINDDTAANILMRCMIKTRTAGADVDGKRIRVTAREWGHTFAEFGVTMGLGNSVAAIFTNTDLNNTTAATTVDTWSTISNVEGYQTIDMQDGDGAQPYYSQWNRDTYSINQLYERAKYNTRRGSSETIYGIDGDLFRGITHSFAYTGNDGSPGFTQNEILSWGTGLTAGTGILLAMTGLTTAAGTCWIQLLTGVAPADTLTVTGGTSSEEMTVNGTSSSWTVQPVFLGQSTGSAIIGAFGVGVEYADLTDADLVFDLLNDSHSKPITAQFDVLGLEVGEDRVLVTWDSSNNIDFDQMSLNGTLSGAGVTTIDVGTGNIPADTPSTGGLRIQLDSGIYRRIPWLSHDTDDEFTIAATGFAAANGGTATTGNNVFIGYIDKLAASATESFEVTYDQTRTMFVRVRDGGGTPQKTFETTAQLNSGGGSATAIHTPDA